ncbi:MAG TPA: acetate/propionate family kinase [Gaiellaceae bacterium]
MDVASRVLVVNAGSSSLKLSVLEGDEVVASPGDLDELGGLGIDVAGHRIVHGGDEFHEPVLIDERVRRRLDALTDLAPLHQPKSLRALDAVTAVLPDVPAVACFDTAFHATIPAAATTYAIPREWRRRWPLRRFGFHGLSHAYIARQLTGRRRIVSCHLGAGASLCAILDGRSVDTTMGFTPLEGLVMATRSGSIDPGLVLWLEEHVGMPPSELAATLERRSGLLGLAGSADMRAILEAEAAGDEDAALAVGVYVHRLRASVCAMAAALGGVDAIAFTGGVGENAAAIRERALQGLDFLGDPEVHVIPAREDLEIAHQVRATLP